MIHLGEVSKECSLVLIEWEDSRQPIASWGRLSDFEEMQICKCVSVGFLLHDGAAQKVLAPNMADIEDKHNIQSSGVIHIPSKCVTRITPLIENGITSTSSLHQEPA
jgi:hypothetical protein